MKRYLLKTLKVLAWSIPAVLILGLLLYAEECWRGMREWEQCQRSLIARGEILDLRQGYPPGAPKDDLSKAPIFAPLNATPSDPGAPINQLDVYLHDHRDNQHPKMSGFLKMQPLDLAAWAQFYRTCDSVQGLGPPGNPARDVLQVLSRFDPQINAIDEATANPDAFLPINYDNPAETNLGAASKIIAVAKFLQLRGVAHLVDGHSELAEKDLGLSFRINRSSTKRGLMVDMLVAVGVRIVDIGILWEGLHRQAWTAKQLQELEALLASEDYLFQDQNSLRSERRYILASSFFQFRGGKNKYAGFSEEFFERSRLQRIISKTDEHMPLRPHEMCFIAVQMQRRIDAIHPDSGCMDQTVFSHGSEPIFNKQIPLCFYIGAMEMLATLDNTSRSAARGETYCRFARLACRLEEYRLAHGSYPKTLTELPDLPSHLNQEVFSTQPFLYVVMPSSYILWSPAWKEVKPGDSAHTDSKDGNWVWSSP